MRTLYICGAGNPETIRLALVINRRESRWDRIVLLDDDPAKQGLCVLGVEIAGPFALLEKARPESDEVVNSVTRTTVRRAAARRRIEVYGLSTATLVHPTVDTMGVELGRDILVYQNVTLGAEARLDDGSVVFMGAVVGHESHLGRGCIVAANAVLNARVELAEGAYVGSNAAILPEVRVGTWATIGAGSMLFQNVPAGATAMGVPGKIVFKLSPRQLDQRRADAIPALVLPRPRVSLAVKWSSPAGAAPEVARSPATSD